MGVDVIRTRYVAVILSGGLAAVGGVYLGLAEVGVFQANMTQGRGFIALAAMIFGKWTPVGAFLASLLFAGSDALGGRFQDAGASWISTLRRPGFPMPQEASMVWIDATATRLIPMFLGLERPRRSRGA